MIMMNDGQGCITGTKYDLLSELALIMHVMLEKKIADEDDLLFVLSMAENVNCKGDIIGFTRDESKNS